MNKDVSPDNKLINNCINALRDLEVEEEESADDDMVPLNPKEPDEYDSDASTLVMGGKQRASQETPRGSQESPPHDPREAEYYAQAGKSEDEEEEKETFAEA